MYKKYGQYNRVVISDEKKINNNIIAKLEKLNKKKYDEYSNVVVKLDELNKKMDEVKNLYNSDKKTIRNAYVNSNVILSNASQLEKINNNVYRDGIIVAKFISNYIKFYYGKNFEEYFYNDNSKEISEYTNIEQYRITYARAKAKQKYRTQDVNKIRGFNYLPSINEIITKNYGNINNYNNRPQSNINRVILPLINGNNVKSNQNNEHNNIRTDNKDYKPVIVDENNNRYKGQLLFSKNTNKQQNTTNQFKKENNNQKKSNNQNENVLPIIGSSNYRHIDENKINTNNQGYKPVIVNDKTNGRYKGQLLFSKRHNKINDTSTIFRGYK